MTKRELLARVKRDRPGESTEQELELWIRQLEDKWHNEVILTHQGAWDLALVPDIGVLSRSRWWGEDGKLEAFGLTVTRRGPRISIEGTATAACEIWINGPQLAISEYVEPAWSYGAPMAGPEEGDWVANYCYAAGRPAVGLRLGKSVDGEEVLVTSAAMPVDGSSVSPSNVSWHTMSWSLSVASGQTYPPGWGLVILLDTEERELPKERIRRDLLIPAIDEEVYVYWLYSKIDFRLGEMERYNNDAAMYNQAWDEAAKRWHRAHMPLGRQVIHNVYGHPIPALWDVDPLNQRGDRGRL